MNVEVSKYISEAPEQQRLIMESLREILHKEVPGLVENFKWSRPVFSTEKDFAYFKSTKAHLSFGFFDFKKICTAQQLLEGNGKDMRHIKLKKMEDLDPLLIKNWLREILAAE